MPFERQISAGEVVKRVLASVGLPQPSEVVTATDATSRQMWALLRECGQDLIDKHDWRFLSRTFTLNTIPGTLVYDLPNDWQSFTDSTGWNNTSRVPLIGPLTDQQWRLLKARQLGGTTLRMQYILSGGKIEFYFVPPSPQTIEIDYTGRGWVRDSTNPLVFSDAPTVDADIVLYNPRLIIECLRYRWREAKGFDTAADFVRYNEILEHSKYNDSPKNDLCLSGRSQYPYLGYYNMPDTNYGGS